jgi:hypothetical protein
VSDFGEILLNSIARQANYHFTYPKQYGQHMDIFGLVG